MIEISFDRLRSYSDSFDEGRMLMHVDVKSGEVRSLEEQYRP